MDILRLINENSKQLSRRQRQVAQYILENWEKAAYESTSTIANHLGLGQSTIIRTAIALGFRGFPELQHELRQYIQIQVSSVSRLDRANQDYTEGKEKGQNLVARIFEVLAENLQGAYRQLQQQDIDQAVDDILAADRIFLIGMRSSASIAYYLGFNLSMIFQNVFIIEHDYRLPEYVRTFSPQDVLIAIAFPRYARQTVLTVQAAHEHGVKTIGITDSLSSPIADGCDTKFLIPVSSIHFNSSPMAAIAIADVLLARIALQSKVRLRIELQSLEKEFERFKIFSR